MPTELEHVCTCGQAIWNEMLWVVRVGKNGSGYCVQCGYCPDCGCYLDPNGCACEMVRADSAGYADRVLTSARAVPKSAEEMAALPAQEQLSLIREGAMTTGYGDSVIVSDLQLGGVGLAIAALEKELAVHQRAGEITMYEWVKYARGQRLSPLPITLSEAVAQAREEIDERSEE